MTAPLTQAVVEAARAWRRAEVVHAAVELGLRDGDRGALASESERALHNLRIAAQAAFDHDAAPPPVPKGHDGLDPTLDGMTDQLGDRLGEALERYGGHLDNCFDAPCICGLAAALASRPPREGA